MKMFIQISMVLTAIAVVCQTLAICMPGWIIIPKSLSTLSSPLDEQYGIWYFCFGWKNCSDYFAFFSVAPGMNRHMLIPLVTESIALCMLMFSFITSISALFVSRRTALVKFHFGLNIAACFIIMCGILSTVTYYGHQGSTGYRYGYAFALAVAASGLSLISALFACGYEKKKRSHKNAGVVEQKQHFEQDYYPQQYYQGAAPYYA